MGPKDDATPGRSIQTNLRRSYGTWEPGWRMLTFTGSFGDALRPEHAQASRQVSPRRAPITFTHLTDTY